MNGDWGHPKSGAYALPQYTQVIRRELPRIFRQFKITTMFDAPCGDFTWMRNVFLPPRYIGGDIVHPLIRDLQDFHETDGLSFVWHDITKHKFPRDIDLWFCRDCLYMLTLDQIAKAFESALRSDVKYFMFTSHFNRMNVVGDANADRQQNLNMTPFNFPSPLEWIDDWCDDEKRPGLVKRHMGLWSRAQLAESMATFSKRFK